MPGFFKKMVMFLKNFPVFFEKLKVFFEKFKVFLQHSAWASSCIFLNVHVCTHRSTHTVTSACTYIRIGSHVRTHKPRHIYVIVSDSVTRLQHPFIASIIYSPFEFKTTDRQRSFFNRILSRKKKIFLRLTCMGCVSHSTGGSDGSFTLIPHRQAVPAAVMCERRYAISFLPLNFRLLAAEK